MAEILQPIAVTTSTFTVNKKAHAGAVLVANRAAGITFTLPASSGDGSVYEFFTLTTITSNNLIIQVANSTDILSGQAIMATDNASDVVISFETGASDDTITMNGSTKGGIKGDRVVIKDVSSGVYHITAFLTGTGTEVTPFSSAV